GVQNSGSGGPALASLGTGGGVFNALGSVELDTGDILAPSVVTVTDGALVYNQAQGGPGATGLGGDGWGGALAGLFGATTTVTNSTLANNLAVGGQGGGGNGHGGGGYNDVTSSLTLRTSTVTINHANGGDGGE